MPEMEFIKYSDFVESLSRTDNPALTDKQVVSNTTNGPRAVPSNARAMANEQTEGKIKVYGENGAGYFDIEKIFNNFAGKFDPTRTEENRYHIGESVTYKGSLYVFISEHYGAWDASHVDSANVRQDVLCSDGLTLAINKKNTINLTTSSNLTYVYFGKFSNHVKFTIHNTSSEDSWFFVGIYDESKTSIFSKSVLVAASSIEVVEFTTNLLATYVGYRNVNNRQGISIDVESEGYSSLAYNVSKILEREVNGKIFYVEKIGSYSIPSSVGSLVVTVVNESSSAKYAYLEFYDAEGGTRITTTGNLLVGANSSVTKMVYLKTASGYVTFGAMNQSEGLSAKIEAISYEDRFSLSSDNVAELDSCSVRDYNVTRTQAGNDVNIVFSSSTLNSGGNIQITCPFDISVGDFVFASMDVEVDEDCFVDFTFYTQGTEQSNYQIGLKAGKSYPIYIASKDVVSATAMHLNVGLPGYSNISATNVIRIKNCVFCKNDFLVSEKTSDNFKARKFTKEQRTFVVSASGDGDFVTINHAITYMKLRLSDIASKPSSLYIRNGDYNMEWSNKHTVGYPYAAINKGSNMISLIGESREGVVVTYTSNNTVRLKVLDIGDSECTIANMTINSLQDETYTDYSGEGHQNCYCIHSDLGTLIDHAHNTVLKNLRLLSHCHSPLGAGIQRNQHLVIDDCVFISDTKVGNSAGACYIHALANGDGQYDSTMKLTIRNCDFKSYDSTFAITLQTVGTSSFSDIKTTFNGMRVYSNGTPVSQSVLLADLDPSCSGNNVADLNLAEY